MTFSIRRTTLAVAAVGLSLGLVSCAGGQSVAEACKIAEVTLTDASADLATESQSFMTDAVAGKDVDIKAAFDPMLASLKDAQSKITNAEVKAPLDDFVTEFGAVTDLFGEFDFSILAGLGDTSNLDMTDAAAVQELQDKAAKAQEQSLALSEKVNDHSTKLQTAADQLAKLCNAG
ncbi:hypothetical protein ICM05_00600 [Leucobacter sp. cx-42]|uniref:hypothetical protein n=1 Tax=unclassified Leucobacter TaxID=2621730 RepID=UPI00165DA226|nr:MULTISPECIES: hypothetical protein [unclassified Leucobacter]MBC9953148.1 hypothetical protein [Leucobacter sp. cx-42]